MKYLQTKEKFVKAFARTNICIMMQKRYSQDMEFYGKVLLGAVEEAKQNGYDMNALRVQPPKMLHRESVIAVADYLKGINGLPRSNVLEFQTKYAKVLIRPSGTEPKVKVYLSSRAATIEQAAANNQAILEEIANTYLK